MTRPEDLPADGASAEEVDLLADLDAGLLEGEERARAEVLAATERGRAVLAALDRVRADLAGVATPALPADWPATLSQLLRAERDRSTLIPPGRRATPGRRAARAQWLVGAAAAVALGAVVVTATVTGETRTGGQAADTTSAAGGAAESAVEAPAREAGALPLAPPVFTTGRDYDPADLPGAVMALASDPMAAADEAGGRAAHGADAGSAGALGLPAELERLTEPGPLAECLRGLTSGQEEPVAVDLARFQGVPALVVVTRTPGSGGTTAYVAGPGCSAATTDLLHLSRE